MIALMKKNLKKFIVYSIKFINDFFFLNLQFFSSNVYVIFKSKMQILLIFIPEFSH